eukprot:TRINITY_DN64450_c0_g1_i1.p1 TRINITY_DN64450_c0_g1~~TRINITY_DN64450_c0_g1_i1.p1  ORF type:complete len:218 (-),score=0.58 TRINITY_DN64450_c0_g1_i1:107-760(-)
MEDKLTKRLFAEYASLPKAPRQEATVASILRNVGHFSTTLNSSGYPVRRQLHLNRIYNDGESRVNALKTHHTPLFQLIGIDRFYSWSTEKLITNQSKSYNSSGLARRMDSTLTIRRFSTFGLLCCAVAGATVIATGCADSNPHGLVPVSGKVLLDGEPLPHGVLHTVTNNGKGASGGIQSDGTFELVKIEYKELGKQKITINKNPIPILIQNKRKRI